MFKPVAFHAAADVVVLFCDPERADYVNRRGEVYGYRAYVIAEDAKGNRVSLPVGAATHFEQDALAPAVVLADRLQSRLDKLGLPPVRFAEWRETRPAYGSDAYIEYGQADDVALERVEADEELFA